MFGKIFLIAIALTGTILHFEEKHRLDPNKFLNAQIIEKPEDADAAWVDISKCSKGSERAFKKVKWFIADNIPMQAGPDEIVAGAYIGQHHSIVILRSIYNLDVNHPLRHVVIRHELMHLKEFAAGHSTKFFNEACGTMKPGWVR